MDNSFIPSLLKAGVAALFSSPAHRSIHAAIARLHAKGADVDLRELHEELRVTGEVDQLGGTVEGRLLEGVSYLGSILDLDGRAARFPEHLTALQEFEDPEVAPLSTTRILETSGLASLPENPDLDRLRDCLQRLRELVRSDPLDRAVVREGAIRHLKTLALQAPAAVVDAALACDVGDDETQRTGQGFELNDPDPWPEPVVGNELIDGLTTIFGRFLALVDGAAEAMALWVVAAHCIEATTIFPILALVSPEKRCGKTTALELLSALVPRALQTSNITAAALFRAVERYTPTLLVDEADTFLRDSDELRGVLNSGHSRNSAFVIRTVGDNYEPRHFSTWCPKAIALIGKLPATLEDRALVIEMRRRKRSERVERLRRDRLASDFEPYRRKAARWASDHLDALRAAEPDLPPEMHDRAQDNWRPLVAIADLIGDSWPARARETAVHISANLVDDEGAPAVQLLADLHGLFGAAPDGRLSSQCIVDRLSGMEGRPWPEWRCGKPITPRQVATLLRRFGIRPKQLWIDGKNVQGYDATFFEDAFSRYLPPIDPLETLDTHETNDLSHDRDLLGGPVLRGSAAAENPRQPHILGDLGDQGPHLRTPNAPSRPCPMCGGWRWWLSVAGTLTCQRCHPPAAADLVARRFDLLAAPREDFQ